MTLRQSARILRVHHLSFELDLVRDRGLGLVHELQLNGEVLLDFTLSQLLVLVLDVEPDERMLGGVVR